MPERFTKGQSPGLKEFVNFMCQKGDEPLSGQMPTLFTDTYVRHQEKMN